MTRVIVRPRTDGLYFGEYRLHSREGLVQHGSKVTCCVVSDGDAPRRSLPLADVQCVPSGGATAEETSA